jgi:hypothetical protein
VDPVYPLFGKQQVRILYDHIFHHLCTVQQGFEILREITIEPLPVYLPGDYCFIEAPVNPEKTFHMGGNIHDILIG